MRQGTVKHGYAQQFHRKTSMCTIHRNQSDAKSNENQWKGNFVNYVTTQSHIGNKICNECFKTASYSHKQKSLCWSKLLEQVQKMAWACGFVIISIYTLLRILNMWPFVLFLICYAVTSQNKKIYYISKTFRCTQTLKQLQDILSIIRQGVWRWSKPLHLMLNLKRNGYAMTVIYHYSKELLETLEKTIL